MMAESTSLRSNTSNEDDANKKTQDSVPPTSTASPPPTSAPAPPPKSPHEEAIQTLQEAFPSVDREVIEAILESQRGNVNASFDILLGMSDPDYQTAPTNTNSTVDDRYALEQQEKDDALLARQLANEYDQQQQRREQAQQQRQDNESVFSGFQEELPVIKERVIEAGNAAKKKIMGFYNSFMEQGPSDTNNGNYTSRQQGGLTNDMQGLRISSDTTAPPLVRTSDQQMEDDAAFARRLAMEDAHLERLAAERQQRSVMQTSPPPLENKSLIDVEEGDAVTFTTPDAASTNKQKKDQRSAYVINDEDDDDIDYYGVDDNDLPKDGQQKDKQHQETTSPSDPKPEHK